MNPIHDPNLQSTADRNVEQLVSHAYRPESPDPAFASRLADLLIQRAADRPERKTFRNSPSRWKRFAALGMAAAIAAACGLFALHLLHHRAAWPVARNGLPKELPTTPIEQRVEPAGANPKRTDDSAYIVPAHSLPDPPVAKVNPGQSIEIQAGQRRRVLLADGSHLFIDQSTRLAVDAPCAITVSAGEVFVEVSPRDASDPFVVHTPKREVARLERISTCASPVREPASS